ILSTLVRLNQIDIIGLQETKLNHKDEEEINLENPKIIFINNPTDNNNTTAGTAFVINKDKVQNKTWTHTIVIPGRLSVLNFKNTESQQFKIINLYSPNDQTPKKAFYEEVLRYISSQQWTNPILIGDFNMVEKAIDRYPEHPDDNGLTKIVNQIINKLELIDGWRDKYTETKDYTFTKRTPLATARLDCIYVQKQILETTEQWKIDESCNLSDHRLVLVTITQSGLPKLHEGLW
ncbi:Endonuclease/exonuclease/phosphatase, partial [Suillus bovinus]|uniref:Endonuclease/exonuclease/phosphatase n=1 Tax=Suillus bovinus TaxID=48563 RepID=UPI001B87298D